MTNILKIKSAQPSKKLVAVMGGGLKPLLYQDKVGSLCARDSKGIGNQYVDENKLIVCKIGAEK
ncbi:MAG: hypothetical protein PHS82_03240 [Lachnospiraceae bacterium]|nr:hypothetical protein [Lachnospiraceae bacterium]